MVRHPCAKCGAEPLHVTPAGASDDEGYHYIVCGKDCGQESQWDKTSFVALKKWNDANPIPKGSIVKASGRVVMPSESK